METPSTAPKKLIRKSAIPICIASHKKLNTDKKLTSSRLPLISRNVKSTPLASKREEKADSIGGKISSTNVENQKNHTSINNTTGKAKPFMKIGNKNISTNLSYTASKSKFDKKLISNNFPKKENAKNRSQVPNEDKNQPLKIKPSATRKSHNFDVSTKKLNLRNNKLTNSSTCESSVKNKSKGISTNKKPADINTTFEAITVPQSKGDDELQQNISSENVIKSNLDGNCVLESRETPQIQERSFKVKSNEVTSNKKSTDLNTTFEATNVSQNKSVDELQQNLSPENGIKSKKHERSFKVKSNKVTSNKKSADLNTTFEATNVSQNKSDDELQQNISPENGVTSKLDRNCDLQSCKTLQTQERSFKVKSNEDTNNKKATDINTTFESITVSQSKLDELQQNLSPANESNVNMGVDNAVQSLKRDAKTVPLFLDTSEEKPNLSSINTYKENLNKNASISFLDKAGVEEINSNCGSILFNVTTNLSSPVIIESNQTFDASPSEKLDATFEAHNDVKNTTVSLATSTPPATACILNNVTSELDDSAHISNNFNCVKMASTSHDSGERNLNLTCELMKDLDIDSECDLNDSLSKEGNNGTLNMTTCISTPKVSFESKFNSRILNTLNNTCFKIDSNERFNQMSPIPDESFEIESSSVKTENCSIVDDCVSNKTDCNLSSIKPPNMESSLQVSLKSEENFDLKEDIGIQHPYLEKSSLDLAKNCEIVIDALTENVDEINSSANGILEVSCPSFLSTMSENSQLVIEDTCKDENVPMTSTPHYLLDLEFKFSPINPPNTTEVLPQSENLMPGD